MFTSTWSARALTAPASPCSPHCAEAAACRVGMPDRFCPAAPPILLSSDTPSWAFWLIYGRVPKRQIQRQILSFVGLKPVRHTRYSPVEHSTPRLCARWLRDTQLLGACVA